jgi:hypothetical protein
VNINIAASWFGGGDMEMTHAWFLVALADQLDMEGKPCLADEVDNGFEEFLKLLESGEFTPEYEASGGQRDPRLPYGNRGAEMPIFGVPGPQ